MNFRKQAMKYGSAIGTAGAGLLGMVQSAHAALDTSATGPIATGITAAQTSSESVGGLVVAAVAVLAVIGLAIGIVRKL